MSAFVETKIWPVSTGEFVRQAEHFTKHSYENVAVKLRYKGGEVEEWSFFIEDRGSERSFVLRRPLDQAIGTAEYVRAILSNDGTQVEFFPRVLIQNDSDYAGMGTERFASLRK